MTVIAWDGKTLAGDRMRDHYGTPIPARKVYRIKDQGGRTFLVGCSGNSFAIAAYIRWAKGEGKEPGDLGSTSIISIDERKRVWCAEKELHWLCIGKRKWAIGCGADYALGVMTHGGSAVDAVRVASKLSSQCGLGVNTVRF